jgi:proteasome lid subunit RPN8/RPN11
MIRIEEEAWRAILAHARSVYPEECCGALLGLRQEGLSRVLRALPLENAHPGPRRSRYQVRPEELLEAERQARREGVKLVGIYHSHPDCPAYFSRTDLENACPWYCFLVVSICQGRFAGAGAWTVHPDQAAAAAEELLLPEVPPEAPARQAS